MKEYMRLMQISIISSDNKKMLIGELKFYKNTDYDFLNWKSEKSTIEWYHGVIFRGKNEKIDQVTYKK
jgi:hypothetical protein